MTFEQAKIKYSYRYTMEHIPAWARIINQGNGKYYAPQYKTDKEWYDNTDFPLNNKGYCISKNPSWPLGEWLDKPYQYVNLQTISTK